MSSIISSIKDLIASVFEVIFSVFHAAFDATSGLFKAIIDSFMGILRMVLHTVGNTFEAAGGVTKFIASKFCFLSTILGFGGANTSRKVILLALWSSPAVHMAICGTNVVKDALLRLETRSWTRLGLADSSLLPLSSPFCTAIMNSSGCCLHPYLYRSFMTTSGSFLSIFKYEDWSCDTSHACIIQGYVAKPTFHFPRLWRHRYSKGQGIS